jgi:chitosanase
MREDKGGLTYGKHQTTIHTDNLYKLLKAYCDRVDSTVLVSPEVLTARLLIRQSLRRFKRRTDYLRQSEELYGCSFLVNALMVVGRDDPVMHRVQDAFFTEEYWGTTQMRIDTCGLTHPLSKLVGYDSTVHGSWGRMAKRATANLGYGPLDHEKEWIVAYLQARHAWLSGHSRPILQRTAYRTHALLGLAGQTTLRAGPNWELEFPIRLWLKSPWRDEMVVIEEKDLA